VKKTFLFVLVALIGGCIDIPISRLIFSHYCNTQQGMFVYEKVGLRDEHFSVMASDWNMASKYDRWIWTDQDLSSSRAREQVIDGIQIINLTYFEKKYRYERIHNIKLSRFGPVDQHKYRVIRLADDKILSESSSISVGPGWVGRALPFPGGGEGCKLRQSGSSETINASYEVHQGLIRSTFYKIGEKKNGQR
jgi:hypothetical protein